MAAAGLSGLQAYPKRFRHGLGIAAVTAGGAAADDRGCARPRLHRDHGNLHNLGRGRGAGISRADAGGWVSQAALLALSAFSHFSSSSS